MTRFFKSALSRIKDIKKRNAAFAALTAEQKRKEIAWDVLTTLIAGQITAAAGSYWGTSLRRTQDYSRTAEDFQCKLLDLPGVAKKEFRSSCAVCARGAVMLSTIRLGNKIHPRAEHATQGSRPLLQGFTMGQMHNMEQLYESGSPLAPYVDNSDAMLGNIMCNVITNGSFKKNDYTDYLKLYKIKLNTTEHSSTREFDIDG